MQNIVIEVSEKVQKYLDRYVTGLIVSTRNRSCVNISNLFDVSHDVIRKFLLNTMTYAFPRRLLKVVAAYSVNKRGWLIIDDTGIMKRFASFIECITEVYDTALGREYRGISIVVLAWSNGEVTIPFSFRYWYKKKSKNKNHKTKVLLAQELGLYAKRSGVQFDYLLADGAYYSIDMVLFLNRYSIFFEMRAHTNRSVLINGVQKQLQDHAIFKMYRNQRKKTAIGYWHGIKLYFTAHKRKNKNGTFSIVYQVSNAICTPETHVNRYEQRWEIEKMFRAMKQKLGLKECSSRKKDSHTQHIYAVFWSYAFLQNEKVVRNLKNVETVANEYSAAKIGYAMRSISLFNRNFQCFA